jgi:ATP-binding cassette subfamily B protein
VAGVLGRASNKTRPVQGWTLDPAERHFWRRVREAGGLGLLARALAGFTLSLVLALGAWLVVGRGALDGRLEPGWLWAWALILGSMVGCQAVASWAVGKLAVHLGGLTKERLLEGILALAPRRSAAGGWGSSWARCWRPRPSRRWPAPAGRWRRRASCRSWSARWCWPWGGAAAPPGLLALWVAVVGFLGGRYHRRLLDWAAARLTLTHDLVESMVGHRTLVVQRAPDRHESEEDALGSTSGGPPRSTARRRRLATLAPRGWLAVGLVGLGPGSCRGRHRRTRWR